MNVLGIDYSLNGTGLSIYNGKKVIFKKVFTSIKKDYENDKEVFILSPKFKTPQEKLDWVCETIINCTDYDFVCMEDHIGSYYEWMDGYGVIKYLLRKKQVPYLMISPTQLKRYAGSGKADKSKMSYYLKENYNMDFDYIGKLANNIVDATWLAIVGYKFYEKNKSKKLTTETIERYKILNNLQENYFGRDNDFTM